MKWRENKQTENNWDRRSWWTN